MDSRSPRHFNNLLLSQPRTCSHFLTRVLNLPAQPVIHKHPGDGYFFLDILGARFGKQMAGVQGAYKITADEQSAYDAVLQKCVKSMEDWVAEVADNDKGCFVKQHVSWMIDPASEKTFIEGLQIKGQKAWDLQGPIEDGGPVRAIRSEGNETVLPDALLKKFSPTILVRHPALAFPSLVRACRDVMDSPDGQDWSLNYHWSRRIYEWYDNNLTAEGKRSAVEGVEFPIILDSDDFAFPALVEKYAKAIGLDKDLLRWTWVAATAEEVEKEGRIVSRLKDTLNASQGYIKGKGGESLDLEVEKAKWILEFGQDLGTKIGELVDKSMPDYMWLRDRRLAM